MHFKALLIFLQGVPSLEAIKILCGHENMIGVVFEHKNIRRLDISTVAMEVESRCEETRSKRLTLTMSRLEKVKVVESSKRLLEVVANESETVTYSRHNDV